MHLVQRQKAAGTNTVFHKVGQTVKITSICNIISHDIVVLQYAVLFAISQHSRSYMESFLSNRMILFLLGAEIAKPWIRLMFYRLLLYFSCREQNMSYRKNLKNRSGCADCAQKSTTDDQMVWATQITKYCCLSTDKLHYGNRNKINQDVQGNRETCFLFFNNKLIWSIGSFL